MTVDTEPYNGYVSFVAADGVNASFSVRERSPYKATFPAAADPLESRR
jgi:hypothetical protein